MGCHSPAGMFWSSLVAALDPAAHPEVTDNQDEQMWQCRTEQPMQRLLTTRMNEQMWQL